MKQMNSNNQNQIETEAEEDGDLYIDLIKYPQTITDEDEARRAFIFEYMSNSDIDGNILVQNMETSFQWLKNGAVPKKSKPV